MHKMTDALQDLDKRLDIIQMILDQGDAQVCTDANLLQIQAELRETIQQLYDIERKIYARIDQMSVLDDDIKQLLIMAAPITPAYSYKAKHV